MPVLTRVGILLPRSYHGGKKHKGVEGNCRCSSFNVGHGIETGPHWKCRHEGVRERTLKYQGAMMKP